MSVTQTMSVVGRLRFGLCCEESCQLARSRSSGDDAQKIVVIVVENLPWDHVQSLIVSEGFRSSASRYPNNISLITILDGQDELINAVLDSWYSPAWRCRKSADRPASPNVPLRIIFPPVLVSAPLSAGFANLPLHAREYSRMEDYHAGLYEIGSVPSIIADEDVFFKKKLLKFIWLSIGKSTFFGQRIEWPSTGNRTDFPFQFISKTQVMSLEITLLLKRVFNS